MALGRFRLEDVHEDGVADIERGLALAMAAEEFAIADDAFALGADVDEDLVLVDPDDVALDDVAVLEALDIGVLLGQQLGHRGRLRPKVARGRGAAGSGSSSTARARGRCVGRLIVGDRVVATGGLDRRGRHVLDHGRLRLGCARRLGRRPRDLQRRPRARSVRRRPARRPRRRRPQRCRQSSRRSDAGRPTLRWRQRWWRARRRPASRRRDRPPRSCRKRSPPPGRGPARLVFGQQSGLSCPGSLPRITNGLSEAQAVSGPIKWSVVIYSAVRSFVRGKGLAGRSSAVLPSGPGESSTRLLTATIGRPCPNYQTLTVVAEAFHAALAGRPDPVRRGPRAPGRTRHAGRARGARRPAGRHHPAAWEVPARRPRPGFARGQPDADGSLPARIARHEAADEDGGRAGVRATRAWAGRCCRLDPRRRLAPRGCRGHRGALPRSHPDGQGLPAARRRRSAGRGPRRRRAGSGRGRRDAHPRALARPHQRHPGELKNLLRNQAFVAGIGNAYSDEIVHAAGLLPFRKRASLAAEEIDALYEATRSTLRDAIDILRERVPPTFERRSATSSPSTTRAGSRARAAGRTSPRSRRAGSSRPIAGAASADTLSSRIRAA